MAAVQFVSLVFGCLAGCFLNRVSVSKECVCKSRKQSETARGKLEKGEGKRREEKRSRLTDREEEREIQLWRAERMEEKGVQILRKRDAKGFLAERKLEQSSRRGSEKER